MKNIISCKPSKLGDADRGPSSQRAQRSSSECSLACQGDRGADQGQPPPSARGGTHLERRSSRSHPLSTFEPWHLATLSHLRILHSGHVLRALCGSLSASRPIMEGTRWGGQPPISRRRPRREPMVRRLTAGGRRIRIAGSTSESPQTQLGSSRTCLHKKSRRKISLPSGGST
jgi:hypothetical protein